MKTETSHSDDPMWTNNVGLLTQDECLPIMGGCQVSTILQNLDTSDPQNLNLIIIPPSELKAPHNDNSFNVQNNYIIIKDNSIVRKEKSPPLKNDILEDKKKKDNFEDMLYFVCNLCPFLCTQDSKITEHLENAHKSNTFIKLPELKCPACANVFYHRMSLRSHLIHDHGVGNSDLTRIIQAVSYYSTKHKDKQKIPRQTSEIICKSLEKKTFETDISDVSQTYDIDRSDIKRKEEEKVVLPQVDITHNNSEKMISSLMKQSSPTGKYCDSKKANSCIVQGCKVRLQAMDKMTYHLNSHFENGFRCNECGERFLGWKPLTSHLWRSHKVDMELFACDKCDYRTVSLAKLNNIHKLIHSETRAYTCNICEKSFKNVKQLRNHKFIHREKTKHSCPDCLKSFSYKGQLKMHMDVVHKKLKPFLCNFCGYKGSSKTSLKMHSRQHTGEKPFTCSFCSYSTSDHNSLRRHTLRHTGHKPYKCTYCSYACIQSSTFKAHLKTQHPGLEKDLMFNCPECQFRSVNKEVFNLHLIKVHMVKPDNL